jgi:hypothetical protein
MMDAGLKASEIAKLMNSRSKRFSLRDYVVHLNADKQPLHEDVIYAETKLILPIDRSRLTSC